MQRLLEHDAMPHATADEAARQDFVRDLRIHIAGRLSPGLATHWQKRVGPAYEKAHGGPPSDRHQVRKAMEADVDYQLWSLMQRTSQELGWASVIDSVERALPGLIAQFRDGDRPLGSLSLDPDLEVPRYNTSHDIHLMPGGYHSEQVEDDLAAGAIFDRGVHIWGTGAMGPENDLLGRITARYFKQAFPDVQPKRILDMGCTIGAPTTAWARAFPDAEVHGIDVAAPCLRYGHLRANALGLPVHFHHMNAEETGFPDGHFDVVVSHILFHETSARAVPRIMAECFRLLRPGGVTLHVDTLPATGEDHFRDFLFEWEVDNNAENFLRALRDMSLVDELTRAGFPDARVDWAEGDPPEPGEASYFSVPKLPVQVARKPE